MVITKERGFQAIKECYEETDPPLYHRLSKFLQWTSYSSMQRWRVTPENSNKLIAKYISDREFATVLVMCMVEEVRSSLQASGRPQCQGNTNSADNCLWQPVSWVSSCVHALGKHLSSALQPRQWHDKPAVYDVPKED